MLTYNGNNVKLIDFGLSDSDSHSVLKGSAGTQVYASPELISGGSVDFRSDIFSLGCVIDRLSPNFGKVVRKCCQRDPKRRFQSALEVKEAIKSRPKALWGILVIVLLIISAVAILFQPLKRLASAPASLGTEIDTMSNHADKDSLLPALSAPQGNAEEPDVKVPKANQPQKKPVQEKTHSDKEAIDELFRQATELFDQ